jgi:hypothetical protein
MLDEKLIWSHMERLSPESASVLRAFIDEAFFFEKLMQSDLDELPNGSVIVEIGGGIGLLALLLAKRGYQLLVYEPGAAGFGQMSEFRQIIMDSWVGELPDVSWFDVELTKNDVVRGLKSRYVYAINVIEHVPNTSDFLGLVMNVVEKDGSFRFICPNYLIPFEPHFNFPTFFSKTLTGKVMGKRIRNSVIDRAEEFWNDLSWPTPRTLKRQISDLGCHSEFSRKALISYLERAGTSETFIARKGLVGRYVLRPCAKVGGSLASLLPVALSPIIDCRVTHS